MTNVYNLSTARNFAERARGFLFTSTSDGTIGRRLRSRAFGLQPQEQTSAPGGQRQAELQRRKPFLTSLSSSEWNETVAIRPPGKSNS
jgi:hypothetical protein